MIHHLVSSFFKLQRQKDKRWEKRKGLVLKKGKRVRDMRNVSEKRERRGPREENPTYKLLKISRVMKVHLPPHELSFQI